MITVSVLLSLYSFYLKFAGTSSASVRTNRLTRVGRNDAPLLDRVQYTKSGYSTSFDTVLAKQYDHDIENYYAFFSAIDYINETAAYPLYQYFAAPINVDVQAGQCLYIPPGWWHHTTNHEHTYAVNFWGESTKENMLSLQPQCVLDLDADNKRNRYVDREALTDLDTPILCDMQILNNTQKSWDFDYFQNVFGDHKFHVWYQVKRYEKWETAVASGFSTEMTMAEMAANPKGLYLITLPAFMRNDRLKEGLLPDLIPLSNDPNFWISIEPGIRTGLHYDTLEGNLCVVNGAKTVLLFHPLDSVFMYSLRDYVTVPSWVKPHAETVWYNLYKAVSAPRQQSDSDSDSDSDSEAVPDIPSSELLYVSLRTAYRSHEHTEEQMEVCEKSPDNTCSDESSSSNQLQIARAIADIEDTLSKLAAINNTNRMIYGAKRSVDGNYIRWELYFYNLAQRLPEGSFEVALEGQLIDRMPITGPDEIVRARFPGRIPMIKSIDLLPDGTGARWDQVHYWLNDNPNGVISLPMNGIGLQVTKGNDSMWQLTMESDFYIGFQQDVAANATSLSGILSSIKCCHNLVSNNTSPYTMRVFIRNVIRELKRFPCREVAIYNKYVSGEFGLQWFGISPSDFHEQFLKKYGWNIGLEDYYLFNRARYTRMSHEITINYKVLANGKLQPMRSAFYGMI